MSFRSNAILALVPNANFTLSNDKIFNWDSEKVQPTEEEIVSKEKEIIEANKKIQYQRDRSSEYPTWQEQMDMQYHDAKNGTNTWQEAIEAVKTKYPKGE